MSAGSTHPNSHWTSATPFILTPLERLPDYLKRIKPILIEIGFFLTFFFTFGKYIWHKKFASSSIEWTQRRPAMDRGLRRGLQELAARFNRKLLQQIVELYICGASRTSACTRSAPLELLRCLATEGNVRGRCACVDS